MKKSKKLTRLEFEDMATLKLQKAVDKAKKIRLLLRQLEQDIALKETKIRDYQQIYTDLQNQLVKIQAIIYSKGTN